MSKFFYLVVLELLESRERMRVCVAYAINKIIVCPNPTKVGRNFEYSYGMSNTFFFKLRGEIVLLLSIFIFNVYFL